MSVIAKMYVMSSGQVPGGALIRLSCVYDSDLATASAEDVRFTKASLSGEATMELRHGLQEQSQWYLLFDEEKPNLANCDYALKVRCHCVHDYGTSKQVEISTAFGNEEIPIHLRTTPKDHPPFHMKITIDNPHASIQFVPQKHYFLTFYRAGKFASAEEAIALARKPATEAEDA